MPQTCPTLLCRMTSSMTSRSLLALVHLRKRFNVSPFSTSPFPFPPLSLLIISERGSIFTLSPSLSLISEKGLTFPPSPFLFKKRLDISFSSFPFHFLLHFPFPLSQKEAQYFPFLRPLSFSSSKQETQYFYLFNVSLKKNSHYFIIVCCWFFY